MSKPLLDRLKEGVVLGDGGYLLALESRGYVQAGPFTPEVTIEHPNALLALHQEFLHAGAEVLQVMTFYASENKLAQIGYAGKLGDINRAAVKIARQASGGKALVAGNVCLTWKYKEGDSKAADECRKLFDDQIRFQTEVGVDFIIGETFLWVGEALLALECAKKTGLPTMITMSFEGPKTRDGKTPGEAAKILEGAGADIVGTNCWQDPTFMLPVVEEMRRAVKGYVAAQPVAYRCTPEVPFFTGQKGFPDRLDPYQLTRYEMGDFAKKALDLGVNYIGGCCGCEGSHMRQMARAIGKMPVEDREWAINYESPQSATEAYKGLRDGSR
ncbi:MAG: homocysteine S-methyltransferase family protein [Candidatus Latescibacteria bacterium]|nr:homocysteine S-methyltransferase family protein [Candidatus Latescibacterota bacterium]